MVSKCANPACSTLFRYLHEGKLFRMEHSGGRDSLLTPDSNRKKPAVHVEFFWLCQDCSQSMTLIFDPAAGIITRPLRRAFRTAS